MPLPHDASQPVSPWRQHQLLGAYQTGSAGTAMGMRAFGWWSFCLTIIVVNCCSSRGHESRVMTSHRLQSWHLIVSQLNMWHLTHMWQVRDSNDTFKTVTLTISQIPIPIPIHELKIIFIPPCYHIRPGRHSSQHLEANSRFDVEGARLRVQMTPSWNGLNIYFGTSCVLNIRLYNHMFRYYTNKSRFHYLITW